MFVCLARWVAAFFDVVFLPSPVPARRLWRLTDSPSPPFLPRCLSSLSPLLQHQFSPSFPCSVKVPSTSALGVALIAPMILFVVQWLSNSCRILLLFFCPSGSHFHKALYSLHFISLIVTLCSAFPLIQGNEMRSKFLETAGCRTCRKQPRPPK